MVLVTGAAGFIGSNFVLDWLAQSSEPVLNLDALTYAGNLENLASLQGNPRHIFVKGDIGDFDLVAKLLAEHQPRAIVNFAAESHVDRSIHGPEDFIQTNIVGTFRLLEAVRAYWNGLDGVSQRRLPLPPRLHRRSLWLTCQGRPRLRRDPTATNPTARTPPARPPATISCAPTTTPTACRCSPPTAPTTTAPTTSRKSSSRSVIHNALAGKPLPIYGDGQQIRDWLYVKDHCSAIRRVLEAGRVGEVYNIGGWNEKPNLDVVHTLCAILDELSPRADGKPYKEQITYVHDRPGHDRRYAIDATKIERELGWKPAETFETGIRKTVQWYLDNQAWVQNVTSGAYKQWVGKQYGA